ncbi:MAG TPA: ATP-binding protein [Burkholderiales bacterium]|nr:ATP-binding protein [Burkholderiales bacterium]
MAEDAERAVPVDPSEIDTLRIRLAEAEDTLRAIRHGEIDGLLVLDDSGERVYTLRGADAPYRALVEQMGEGAATLDNTGAIIYCNQRFAELVQTPTHQVIGTSIEQFVDPADRTALAAMVHDGTGRLSTRVHRGDQAREAHLSISAATLDGVEYRTLILTDLSMLMQMQRESRSKDEFLAMLAHELRNPLAAISGAGQVLALANLQEPHAMRARETIERQARHMARLVDDLLDVGRVMSGKIVLQKRLIDLAESVRSYVMTLTSSENAGAHVEIMVESVWVQADAVRMEQIIGNLVTNAVKFSPPDKTVRVSLRAEGQDAVLRVIDEGAGIDPRSLPHIFDLFVQDNTTLDRSKRGLGIGLTLVRRLVELHGGTVEASSEGKGRGAVFTVRLPAAAPSTAGSPQAPSIVQPVPKRVLLVEDYADSREMYRIVLENAGHTVYQAEDALHALALLRDRKIDVAIVDIGLPGMDGYELGRRIRAQPESSEVALVALTGYGFPEDRDRARAAGFVRHLVKPVAADELLRTLNDVR